MNLLQATETALHRFGVPYRLGQEIADSWCAGEGSRTTHTRYRRIAMLRAFGCFSTPTALSCFMIENSALSGVGTERPAWFLTWLIVSPLLAGALSGWIIPTRSARAVFHTQVLLLLYSLVIGLGLLPSRDGLYWTLFQLFYGLPIGALSATLFEALHRHYHRTSFRRVTVR